MMSDNRTSTSRHVVKRRFRVALSSLIALTFAPAAMTAQQPVVPSDARIILVTGSTDGLGREVARRLSDSGAHVIVHGRNKERGDALVREINVGKGSAKFYAADFGSLAEVRALAAAITRDYPRLDVLVNNAGIWLSRGDRQLSKDGYELHFAVNYLAGYLLTRELLQLLERGRDARIVNVSSGAQQALDFSDIMLERGYSGSRAYAQSKLAQVLFTIDLASQVESKNISVTALHPATFMNTRMVEEAGVQSRSTVEQGAEAVMRLIVGKGIPTGSYHNGQREARAQAQAYDAEARAQLRALSERLIK